MLGRAQNLMMHLLRINAEEKRSVFLSLLYAIFIGLTQCFVITVPTALFLGHYSSGYLPYIYISTAVVTILFGSGFLAFQKAASVPKLLNGSLIFLSGSLFLLWSLLITADYAWIPIVLIIWGFLVETFSNLLLGIVINSLFTLQQGKRFFGLMWAAQALGGILAGGSLTFLIPLIGINQLIFLSAVCLLLALVAQTRLHPYFVNPPERKFEYEPPKNIKKVSIKNRRNRVFIIAAFVFIAIAVFERYSLDLLFNTEVKQHFITEDKMASFLGIFFAVVDMLNLIVGVFVFRWILTKCGVILALSLLPIGVGILMGATLGAQLLSGTATFVFTLLVVTKATSETLLWSVVDPSILVLFQPLKSVERVWAQAKNETLISPLATLMMGLVLILVDRLFGVGIHSLALVVLMICLIGLCLIPALKKGYISELMAVLAKRVLVKPEFRRLDKENLHLLTEYLKSPFPEEVIYVLQTLEDLDHEAFVNQLDGVLDHPSDDVRQYALEKIEQHRWKGAEPKVRRIFLTDKRFVRRSLLALAAIGGSQNISLLKEHVGLADLEEATAAIIGLIKYTSGEGKEFASKVLENLIRSEKVEERISSCIVLQQVNTTKKCDYLLSLLQDPSASVRKAASKATEKVVDERFYPALIENLGLRGVSQAAALSLRSQGKHLLAYVSNHFDQFSDPIQEEIVKLLGSISGDASIRLLRKLLFSKNLKRVQHALHALTQQHYHATAKDQVAEVNERLLWESSHIARVKEILGHCTTKQTELLKSLLNREVELSQQRIFLLLELIYPESTIELVVQRIATGNAEMVDYAIEMLLTTLNKEEIKQILPMLIYRPLSSLSAPRNDAQEFTQILINIFETASEFYLPAMQAACVYTIGALKLFGLKGIVEKAQKNKADKLLAETAAWALPKIQET